MSYGALMAVARSREIYPENNTRRYENEPMRRMEYDRMPEQRRGPSYEGDRERREEMRYNDEERTGNDMAFRDRRGRRHYDNGRFAPMRSEYDDAEERGVGFIHGGEWPGAEGGEMNYRSRSREMGRASVYENKGGGWVVQGQFGGEKRGREADRPMDEAMANEWTRRMRNDDGSTGPHWPMEQIKQLQQQKKELQEYEPAEVFAVMNMMYSDYSKVAKKFGVNNMDFYVCLTKAWLDDPDAGNEKTAKYYECVVK